MNSLECEDMIQENSTKKKVELFNEIEWWNERFRSYQFLRIVWNKLSGIVLHNFCHILELTGVWRYDATKFNEKEVELFNEIELRNPEYRHYFSE